MTRNLLFPGDPAPWFTCRTGTNERFHFDTAAGHYLVISFLGTTNHPLSAAALKHVKETLRDKFDDTNLSFFAVLTDPADDAANTLPDAIPGYRTFWDMDLAVSRRYGALPGKAEPGKAMSYSMFSLILDPLLRVLALIPLTDAEQHNAALTQALMRLPPVDASIVPHAPVLILPRVFEPDFCRELIGLYEKHGGEESGFMRQRGDKTVGVLDPQFKRRKDFIFEEQPEYETLRLAIGARFLRRLVPEIKKAFQYEVTRIERYLVACYDGEDQGFFRRHRDNTTKGTAHRRFACTLNLNADAYDGGELRFPEFGSRTYRAPTGGVVVFSCSLLHEATPVTRGKRYAFLPFLYDNAAAEIRKENRQHIQAGYERVERT